MMTLDRTEKNILKVAGTFFLGIALWCGGARVGYLTGQEAAQRNDDVTTQDVVGVKLHEWQADNLRNGEPCTKVDVKRAFEKALDQRTGKSDNSMSVVEIYRDVPCSIKR